MSLFKKKNKSNISIQASQMWIFSGFFPLCNSKMNTFGLWTQQDIWGTLGSTSQHDQTVGMVRQKIFITDHDTKKKKPTHNKLITDVPSHVRSLIYSESPESVIIWRHGLYKNKLNQMWVITTDSQPRTTGRWCYHHVFILILSGETSWKTFVKEKT